MFSFFLPYETAKHHFETMDLSLCKAVTANCQQLLEHRAADIGAPKNAVSASLLFSVNASKFHLGLLHLSTCDMDLNNDPGWFCTVFSLSSSFLSVPGLCSQNYLGNDLCGFSIFNLVLRISLCSMDLLHQKTMNEIMKFHW